MGLSFLRDLRKAEEAGDKLADRMMDEVERQATIMAVRLFPHASIQDRQKIEAYLDAEMLKLSRRLLDLYQHSITGN